MLIKNLLYPLLAALLISTISTSANAATRVVVTGEDSNPRSAARTSEIFTRVTSVLQESMSRKGYQVIDEDMLGVKLGFSFNSRRPKTELIETLQVANQTEDATVQSRLAVVYAIFPQVQKLSFTNKLKVRIRGNVYDLRTLSPLAEFEYSNQKAYVIPKSYGQCDAYCQDEIMGKNAREVARELGDVLVKKLDIAVQKIGGSGSGNGANGGRQASSGMSMPVTYNLEMIRFGARDMIMFKKELDAMPDISQVKLIARGESSKKYSFVGPSEFAPIEENILEILMGLGINIDNVRMNMNGENVEVENLN